MNTIDNNELKNIELELLLSIHNFCVENSLRYYLCGGTLLGAIRHKGFIPWDDDIDIQMPRPDYNYLIKNFVPGDNIAILTPGQDGYFYNFSKVVNPKTRLYETDFKPINGYGVYIDVFPLDGMPEESDERIHHFKKLDSIRTQINSFGINKPKLRKNIFEYCRLYYYYLINQRRDVRAYQQEYLELAQKFTYEDSKYVYLTGGAYHIKEIYEKEIYSEPVLVSFEGLSFYAPQKWDNYLRETYGEYMKLPPKEKRVSNHNFRAVYL